MLVDRVGGHLGNVLSCFGLDVESYEAVCDQVMHRLKPLLSHKVFAIVEEPVV